MGAKKFFAKWVTDITPNAKWDLTRYALLTALAGLLAFSIWATSRLSPLLNGLTMQQRVTVLVFVIGFCAVSFVSVLWVLFPRTTLSPLYRLVESLANDRQSPQKAEEPASISPVPPPPPLPARLPVVKEIDLRVEVLDIIFKEHPAGRYGGLLTGAVDGWFILMHLRVTNHGISDVTVTAWKCQFEVGNETWISEASVTPIPPNWYVQKPQIAFAKSGEIEIERPTLERVCEREPLKRGVPHAGWILFDQQVPSFYWGPQNAGFRLELHDSLGGVHYHAQPAKWSKKTTEIQYEASAEDIAKSLFPQDAKK
ncbi:MAG TPA: hypothetical protein VGQ65_00975 [Thermoanaerobaculia bacterium]|jgi:hypothetical protein|nr:hypothetical protein [Thermoanaerobaculia bacterium]